MSSRPVKSFVFLTVTLSVLASAAILPVLAPLIRSLQLSPSEGGWMLSIGSLLMAISAPSWGSAADRFGRGRVMLFGFGGMFLAYVVFVLTVQCGLATCVTGVGVLASVSAARALLGAFLPSIPAAAQALMADHTSDDERSAGMALIGAANGAGLVLGPALGGLASLGGLLWPLFLACALSFVATVYVAAKAPPPIPSAASAREGDPGTRMNWHVGRWLLASTLTWFAIVSVQIAVGFYFQERLRLTNAQAAQQIAIALTLVGASLFASQVLQARWLRWQPKRLLAFGAALWIVGTLVLLFTANAPAYFLAYALLGAGAGFLLPGALAGASLAVAADRQGSVAGLSAATQGIAFVIGPVVSTWLYEQDASAPLWCLVVTMLVLVVLAVAPARLAPGMRGSTGQT
ncbi:MFS transporter [Variovorax paradoxus]|nr:MFS transporter [Variovorax paradoxus]MBT2299407.1 MFS transporter [Variovorax paradoxus]